MKLCWAPANKMLRRGLTNMLSPQLSSSTSEPTGRIIRLCLCHLVVWPGTIVRRYLLMRYLLRRRPMLFRSCGRLWSWTPTRGSAPVSVWTTPTSQMIQHRHPRKSWCYHRLQVKRGTYICDMRKIITYICMRQEWLLFIHIHVLYR